VHVFTREANPARAEYAVRDERRNGVRIRWVNRTFRDTGRFAESYDNPGVAAALAEASEETNGEEKVFFYHCPYLGEDNRCTVYGTPKRPAICSSYPDTPLTFIAKNCAWKPWKDETHADTLAAHAMLALCEHFAGKLQIAIA